MPTKTARRPRRAPAKPKHPDTLRTSERNALNRCRQRWDWSYNDQLKPKREAPALRFGTLVHKALEVYYDPHKVRRPKPLRRMQLPDLFEHFYEKELEATMEEWRNWKDEDDEWHTYRELGVVMCAGYVDHFAPVDDEYIVLAVEQRFETPILVPRGESPLTYPSPINYVGTLDRILFHLPSKRLLFGDYKTTGTDPTKTKHLILDEQAGAYYALAPSWLETRSPESLRRSIARQTAHLPAASRKAVREWRFDGILYDFLKKALPDDRPQNAEGYYLNQNGSVSKMQPGPLFHRELAYRDEGDRQRVLQRIYEDAVEIGQMRKGEMAIKKSPDRFICIGCPFIDLCELHETQASGWEEFRDFTYTQYNPYSVYEIDADELN